MFPLLKTIKSNIFVHSEFQCRYIVVVFCCFFFQIQVQGAILVSSFFQMFIGFTGLIGFLLRFIGPITVAPTITLIGLALFDVAALHAG